MEKSCLLVDGRAILIAFHGRGDGAYRRSVQRKKSASSKGLLDAIKKADADAEADAEAEADADANANAMEEADANADAEADFNDTDSSDDSDSEDEDHHGKRKVESCGHSNMMWPAVPQLRHHNPALSTVPPTACGRA